MRSPWLRSLAVALALVAAACGGAQPGSDFPPLARKWFERASASYQVVDLDDAEASVAQAARVDPARAEIRVLSAKVALARLDHEGAIRALDGVPGAEARALRGRALWYSGQVERAADELEALVEDPAVRDDWAKEVAQLARRGAGRTPFQTGGGLLAALEIPSLGVPALVVPLELDGEPVLGLVATGTPEVLVDSAAGRESGWVSLRFGQRVEVRDVPALTKDLTGISRQLNAPIKVLLGTNLLRRLRPTIDYQGGQFVVRTFEPPAPPQATVVRLAHVRGGGMIVRAALGAAEAPNAALLVDTSLQFPIVLDDGGLARAGVAPSSLEAMPQGGQLRRGVVRRLRLGAFDLPGVPFVHGAPIADLEKSLEVELDGILGAGVLAAFRLTLVDGGRTLYVEDVPPIDALGAPPGGDVAPPGAVPPS